MSDLFKPLLSRLAVVVDLAGLAVHQRLGADDLAAEGPADRLVAEADAEDRQVVGGGLQQVQADAGLVRRAGAGRQEHALRLQAERLGHAHRVVAVDDGLRPQLVQVVDEVVGEAVVVIDHQDHGVLTRG